MKLKDNYDVIIVGAGPAGSTAAKVCAEGGLDVLLLEKRQEIGSPKRCGEGLSLEYLKGLGFKGNENFVAQRIAGASIYAPDNTEISINYGEKYEGVILERKMFDKALAYLAAEAGAKVIAKACVTDVLKEDGKPVGVAVTIDGKRHSMRSKILIASDGVESTIARIAGLNTANHPANIDSAYQYEMAGIEIKNPQNIYIYLGNHVAPRGYVWIFPKGKNVANVGIGIAGHHEKPAKEYLDEWIDAHPEIKKGSIIEVNSGGVPVGGLLKNMVLDNFMVVGDAAHQVNPAHGGGIDEAATSGRLAAETAIKAISNGDTSKKALEEYNTRWWAMRGEKLKKVEKYRLAFDKLSDDEINMVIHAVSGTDLIDLTEGRGEKVIKILLKHPKLFKLARHLL